MSKWLVIYFLVGGLFVFSNSLHAQDTSIIKAKPPASPKDIVIKYGLASFYANKFNGRKTSNGDVYDGSKLSAACNVLPLGTWVKVTNLRNDRSVIVQINDHLHPANKRLVDMSKLAAVQLGFVAWGITRVKVEVLGELKRGKHKSKPVMSHNGVRNIHSRSKSKHHFSVNK